MVGAFRCWSRTILQYRQYHEDEYPITQVIASLRDDAATMFNFAEGNNPGADLGVIVEKLRKHYCGNLTFREQRNAIENLRQGPSEEVADFLVRVGSAVHDLTKDWKGALAEDELRTLQYEVSLTGVREDIHIMLNTEIAKYGRLTPEQMYDAVRTHEAYRSHNKCLEGLSPYTGQQQQQHPHAQHSSRGLGYKP